MNKCLKIKKTKFWPVFFRLCFFREKKKRFFPKKNKLVFFGLQPYTRAIKKSELRDVSSVPPGDGLGAKGKATMIHGDTQQAHALPCPIHHVEKRSCHREGHHDGKDPKNEGQRSR